MTVSSCFSHESDKLSRHSNDMGLLTHGGTALFMASVQFGRLLDPGLLLDNQVTAVGTEEEHLL